MKDRYADALKLRKSGETYKSIGLKLGVSVSRARQIVSKAENITRRKKSLEWTKGLDTKLANTLIGEGFKSKKEVREAILNKRIGLNPASTKGTVFGIGPKYFEVLSEWVGVHLEKNQA
jgi:hypothetical protein